MSGPTSADHAQADKPAGIACPRCGCQHLLAELPRGLWRVVTTKKVRDGYVRYRRCRNCGKRIRTIEKIGEN